MKFLKLTSIVLMVLLAFGACKTSKRATGNRALMDRLYKSLKAELPEASVVKNGDTVKVIYPEIAMFDFNKDVIKQEARPSFRRFAEVIKDFPQVSFIINGYTDNIGPDDVNADLSERRAVSGKNILVEFGVSSSRMSTNGRGAADPIATNATDQGRAANRRVEFVIFQ